MSGDLPATLETRHRGGNAPSHVPSSMRHIPPRVVGGDEDAFTLGAVRDPPWEDPRRTLFAVLSQETFPRPPNAHRVITGNDWDAIAPLRSLRALPRQRVARPKRNGTGTRARRNRGEFERSRGTELVRVRCLADVSGFGGKKQKFWKRSPKPKVRFNFDEYLVLEYCTLSNI